MNSIFNWLNYQSPLLIALVASLGLASGSFLNVLIYRLPLILENQLRLEINRRLSIDLASGNPSLSLIYPSSHCVYCQHSLRWFHNIPLLSFFILGGRCYYCHHSIPGHYLLVEILSCLTTLAIVGHFGPSLKAIALLLLTWGLIAIAAIDIFYQAIPDCLTLSLLWLGLLVNCTSSQFVTPQTAILGTAAGYLTLSIIAKIFKAIRGIEGMGQGDAKLLALWGAWFGWQALPIILLFASLGGTLIGLALLATKRITYRTPLPFGPFLAAAGWLNFLLTNG